MSRHARIEIAARYATCPPHALDEGCPVTGARDEQCLRYLAASQVPHHLRLVAGNGRILASSEEYATRANAVRAVGAWQQAMAEVLDAYPSIPLPWILLDIDGNRIP